MSTSNIPSGISEEMIQALVDNPGQTISNSPNGEATASPPRAQVPIKGYQSDIRPKVEGNTELISGLSSNFAKRLAKQAQTDSAASRKAQEKDQAEKETLLPTALRRDIEALRRQVKRLEKQLKDTQRSSTDVC